MDLSEAREAGCCSELTCLMLERRSLKSQFLALIHKFLTLESISSDQPNECYGACNPRNEVAEIGDIG